MSTSSTASCAAALLRATITATASPTWLTSSTAIDGWPGLTMSGVTGQAQGIEPCSSATSRPVRTATTPAGGVVAPARGRGRARAGGLLSPGRGAGPPTRAPGGGGGGGGGAAGG